LRRRIRFSPLRWEALLEAALRSLNRSVGARRPHLLVPLSRLIGHIGGMEDDGALVPLARGNLESVRELRRLLSKRGIESEIRRPDAKDCGG